MYNGKRKGINIRRSAGGAVLLKNLRERGGSINIGCLILLQRPATVGSLTLHKGEKTMKKAAWIFAVIIATGGASSANARGAYLCSDWQEFGSSFAISGTKIKRKCRNARNSLIDDSYWEVCRPSQSGWKCKRSRSLPLF